MTESAASEGAGELLPGGIALDERVAQGSSAEVFRAHHPRLGRPLAVKVLRPTIDPEGPVGKRLVREATLLQSVAHQNVPQVFDLGVWGSRPYLVLEWVEGPSLRDLLDRAKGPLPLEVALALAVQLTGALDAVHRQGLVHADVKPANVLVSAKGVVKLVDFGLARPSSGAEDESLAGVGTPSYMSPEQILGDRLDARSDLFSLGSVLYEALTGARPFAQDPARSVMQKIRLDRYPPARSKVPSLPPELDRMLARCLAKAPSHRYLSAGALLQDLGSLWARVGTGSPESVLARHLAPVRAPAPRGSRRPAPREPLRQRVVTALLLSAQGAVGLGALCAGWLLWPARPAAAAASSLSQVGPRAPGVQDVGLLRVVAHPWANVAIDGVSVDTTPTAQAFRLTPGVHYVRFTNPAYVTEDRAVRVERGGTLWLDVALNPAPASPPQR